MPKDEIRMRINGPMKEYTHNLKQIDEQVKNLRSEDSNLALIVAELIRLSGSKLGLELDMGWEVHRALLRCSRVAVETAVEKEEMYEFARWSRRNPKQQNDLIQYYVFGEVIEGWANNLPLLVLVYVASGSDK